MFLTSRKTENLKKQHNNCYSFAVCASLHVVVFVHILFLIGLQLVNIEFVWLNAISKIAYFFSQRTDELDKFPLVELVVIRQLRKPPLPLILTLYIGTKSRVCLFQSGIELF